MVLSIHKGTLFLSIISVTAFVMSFGFALYGNDVNISEDYIVKILLVLLALPLMSIVFLLYAFPFSVPAILLIILTAWLITKICVRKSICFQKTWIGLAALLIYISIVLGNVVAVFFKRLGP